MLVIVLNRAESHKTINGLPKDPSILMYGSKCAYFVFPTSFLRGGLFGLGENEAVGPPTAPVTDGCAGLTAHDADGAVSEARKHWESQT